METQQTNAIPPRMRYTPKTGPLVGILYQIVGVEGDSVSLWSDPIPADSPIAEKVGGYSWCGSNQQFHQSFRMVKL